MPNRIVLLRVFALAFAAEIVASLWLLLRSPADGPTLIYKGFPDYELGRIFYWLPLMVLAIIFLSLLEVRLHAHSEDGKAASTRKPLTHFVAMLVSAFSAEALTSVGYWHSYRSSGVRALYESVWYWHRVPRPSYYGWPSFLGYFVDHLIMWAVVVLAGMFAWYLRTKNVSAVR